MEIEHFEQWIGQDVLDVDGEKVGKLEEIYFRGPDAVFAEVKPGLVARKRVMVPLGGAAVSRDFVRLDVRQDALLQENKGGAGLDLTDLAALGEHYGGAYAFDSGEIESASARAQRLAAAEEAARRAAELEAQAGEREQASQDAAARAVEADRASAEAAEAHRAAAAEADAARGPEVP